MSRNILTGLVGAWCPSLGPSGYTLLDRSGRGNHGSLVNMDAGSDWVGSPGGWVLDYDGTDDYVTARATLTGAFTISIWANRRSVGLNTRVMWGNTANTTYAATAKPTSLGTRSDSISEISFLGFTFSNNILFHVLLSRDGANNMRVWKDGVESSSGAVSVTGAYTLGSIGTYSTAPSYGWDGTIGDIAAWNRAFSVPEVAALYQRGPGGLGRLLTQRAQRRVFRTAQGNRRRRLICGAEC